MRLNLGPIDMAQKELQVPCPSCRRPSVFGPGNPWRPFCSERCRGVDLGAWANEAYRVPAESPPDGDPDLAPPDVRH